MTTTTVGPINHQEIDTTGGIASTASLTAETSRAETAEATLQANITTEAGTRADADAALTAKVGGFASFIIAETTETLDASAAGAFVQVWSNITVTLPESTGISAGQTITIYGVGALSTIVTSGSDRIYANGSYYTSVSLFPGQTLSFVNRATSEWDIYQSRLLPGPLTVSQLPTINIIIGQEAYVTDATSPAYLSTVTGGGSVFCRVMYNGTEWVCA